MWMRNSAAAILLTASFSLATANAGGAYPEYRVTVVGPVNSTAADINNAGVVVGSYPVGTNITRGFLNRGKGLVDLGTLGRSVAAVAINDKGKVLGNWRTAGGQQRGFIYAHGKARDIGAVPGRFTTWTDINNAGYATAIGAAPGINNHGHVVGSSDHLGAYVWRGKRMESLSALIDRKSGWTISFPRAINDAGQIAASGLRNGVAYAVRLDLIRPHALGAAHLEQDEETGR